MYYVSMTDKALSGWGKADGKINKLVLECDNFEEAKIVKRNAQDRTEMEDIVIRAHKLYFSKKRYFVTYHDKSDYQRWYQKDRPFKKEEKK